MPEQVVKIFALSVVIWRSYAQLVKLCWLQPWGMQHDTHTHTERRAQLYQRQPNKCQREDFQLVAPVKVATAWHKLRKYATDVRMRMCHRERRLHTTTLT